MMMSIGEMNRADQGTLTLRRVERAASDRIVALVEGSRGHFVRLSFEFGEEEPHLLAGIGFEVADPDEAVENYPPMSLDEALAAVHDLVGRAVADDEFSGTVLVARDGQPVLLEAWGEAVKRLCVANRTDTAFNLGSINKIFTRPARGSSAGANGGGVTGVDLGHGVASRSAISRRPMTGLLSSASFAHSEKLESSEPRRF